MQKLSLDIKQKGASSPQVILNGVDITNNCISLDLSMGAAALTTATIKVIVDDLNYSGDVVADMEK